MVTGSNNDSCSVNCAEGSMAFSGGGSCEGDNQLQSSIPLTGSDNSTPVGWKATCSGGSAKAYAICCCAH
jgi:hypothetical protein